MKPRDMKKTKLNNDGLSLVELLVSMVIIVIVASCFFSGFVIAAKTNSKAKLQHKATSLAQNILEGLKAEDMDGIMRQFGWPVVYEKDSSVGTPNFSILSSDTISTTATVTDVAGKTSEVSNIGFLKKDADGNEKTYFTTNGTVYASDLENLEYNVQEDGLYYLYLNNLMMENTAFDALITLDGSEYLKNKDTDDDSVADTSESGQDYNTELLASVPMMDNAYDAVISDVGTWDSDAIKALKEEIKDGFDVTKISREITISVSNTDYVLSDSVQKVTVKCLYEYEGSDKTYLVAENTIWTNTGNKEYQLRNVFLFIPLSMMSDGECVKWGGNGGTVVLNTPDDREYEFYIVKRSSSSYDTLSEQDTKEENFKLDVYITEEAAAGHTRTDDTVGLSIRTNLGYRLNDNQSIGSNSLQANYYLNGSTIPESNPMETFSIGTLTANESKERILDVKIEIFDHEDNRNVNGTPVDYIGDSEPRTTLEGSIRN